MKKNLGLAGKAILAATALCMLGSPGVAHSSTGSPIVNDASLNEFFVPKSVSIGATTCLDGSPGWEFAATTLGTATGSVQVVKRIGEYVDQTLGGQLEGGIDASTIMSDDVAVKFSAGDRQSIVIRACGVAPLDSFAVDLYTNTERHRLAIASVSNGVVHPAV